MHPVRVALIAAGLVLLRLGVSVDENWLVRPLNLVAGQKLQALVIRRDTVLSIEVARLILLVEHARPSLLRVGVGLPLRVAGVYRGTVDAPTVRPLRHVARVRQPRVVVGELGVRCSDLALVAAPLGRPRTRVLGHGGVCHVADFGLGRGHVILDHGHARVRRLDNIVVLDRSEVEERFFLNRLCRLLLLGLDGRLVVRSHADILARLLLDLRAGTAALIVLLLNEGGRLVHG